MKKQCCIGLGCLLAACALLGGCAAKKTLKEPVSELTCETLPAYSNFYGRWIYNENLEGYVFGNSSSGVEFRFRGTELTVDIEQNAAVGYDQNEISVFIDGEKDSEANIQTIGKFSVRYKKKIAEGLEEGEHTVRILKRHSSSKGEFLVYGASTDGEFLDPPARDKLKIEVFGDSITCGEGTDRTVTGTATAEGGYSAFTENVFHSFAGYCANELDAELQVFGRGGICMYITNSAERLTVSNNYRSANVDRDITQSGWAMYEWDYSLFTPDVIVIYLGTNDYNRGLNNVKNNNGGMPFTADGMKNATEQFIREIVGEVYKKDIPVFLLSGTMAPASGLDGIMRDVKNDLSGQFNVSTLELDPTPYGHPVSSEHLAAGHALAELIRAKLGL